MALQALPHCWVHLVGVSGGEKTYLESIIIIKIYPALSLAIGGQDGMDAGDTWMMCAIYSTHDTWALAFIVGGVGNMIL